MLNESAFRIAYFLSLFFGGIVFLDIASIFFDVIILIWSFFILKIKLKNGSLNIKYSKFISLFLLFYIVTACINIDKGFPVKFLAGLVMIYHSAICFFIFYGMYKDTNFEEVKKEINLLAQILLIVSTLLVFLSFILLLLGDSFTFELSIPIIDNYDKYQRILGIVKNTGSIRFTGVFINPNVLAFSSVVSIIFCHILYRKNNFFKIKRKWVKVLLVTLIISAHFSALILSDSIASFLFLTIYVVLWLFYKMVLERNIISIKSSIKHGLGFLLGCIIIIFGLFSLRSCFQNSASGVIDELYSIITSNDARGDIDEIHFGRPNHDIRDGSGRRKLLQQAIVIFSKHPLLGIGSTTIVDYGSIYFDSGIAFSNFHNGYISILVCNGLIGFILFITFLIFTLFDLIKFTLRKCPKLLKGSTFINLFICLLSYLVFALFEKTLLSEINFMGIFFWAVLGYSMSFFIKYND